MLLCGLEVTAPDDAVASLPLRLLAHGIAMASESGNKKMFACQPPSASVKRRELLRYGTLISFFTGASVISNFDAKTAHAGPGDKNSAESYVPTAEKGAALGVATLGLDSKILSAQLPDLSASFARVIQMPDTNGVDDTATIQALIDGAKGREVRALSGTTYIVSGEIKVPGGSTLDHSGAYFTLKAGAEPTFMFNVSGSLPAHRNPTATLTANATPMTTTITVASTSGIVAGDVLILGDDTPVVQPSMQVIKYYGEQVMVKTVDSPTRFTVHGVVQGTYTTAANAGLHKITFAKNVTIRGGTYLSPNKGSNHTGAIAFRMCLNPRAENVTIIGGDSAGITVSNCRDGVISNPIISDLTDDPANGRYGYGINIGACTEGLTITGGCISRVRHAITTNGHQNHRGIPRGVTVTGVRASQTTGASFDTHAGAEGIEFNNCSSTMSLYGFQVRSSLTSLTNCKVQYSISHAVHIIESGARGVTVQGLTAEKIGGHGVFVNGQVTDVSLTGSIMNHVGGSGFKVDEDNAHRVVVVGNTFRNLGETLVGSNGVGFLDGKYSRGHIIGWNHFIKDSTWTGTGDYTTGVYLPAGVAMSCVHNNNALGMSAVLMDGGSNNRKHGNMLLDAKLSTLDSTVSRIGQVDLGSQATRVTRFAAFDIGAVGTFSASRLFEASLTSRNTSTGARGVARLAVMVSRDGSSASSTSAVLENVQGNFFSSGSGGLLNVSTSVTADGSKLTISVENASVNTQDIIVTLRGG